MSIGVIADLAIGAHPGGADAWAGQEFCARGFTVGAPPDAFNQRGQAIDALLGNIAAFSAQLRGLVNLNLRGAVSIGSGGLSTTFNGIPDVPISHFTLTLPKKAAKSPAKKAASKATPRKTT